MKYSLYIQTNALQPEAKQEYNRHQHKFNTDAPKSEVLMISDRYQQRVPGSNPAQVKSIDVER